ncbi:MAG: peroxiredoxin-like family protein [Pseudomonadota bacterium]
MTTDFEAELARIRRETEAAVGPHHDRLIGFIEGIGQRDRRPAPGDTAPDFALPCASGQILTLEKLLHDHRALSLVFVRGLWCPYCTAQMTALQRACAAYRAAGLQIAVITPETGGRAAETRATLELDYKILCDVDFGAALAYGLLVAVAEQEREVLLSHGYDLGTLYGNETWFMPMATTFIIGADRTVLDVIGEADQRIRPHPDAVLQATVSRLSGA